MIFNPMVAVVLLVFVLLWLLTKHDRWTGWAVVVIGALSMAAMLSGGQQ